MRYPKIEVFWPDEIYDLSGTKLSERWTIFNKTLKFYAEKEVRTNLVFYIFIFFSLGIRKFSNQL